MARLGKARRRCPVTGRKAGASRGNPGQGRWPSRVSTLEALVDVRLTGASCAGRAPLFDDQLDGESDAQRHVRLTKAAEVCHTCPVRIACATAALEHQATGLWAGRIRNPAGNPGRPRKAATA
ncbi:WhiB family transcriptional regulator [Rhodococcus sp. NPDC058521]|uniref:WhiB family transcriptional regulator n=1 Tax=Rhodococcus sp. NPDC058521 TaxID=3346536 RepID=UPI00365D01DD